MATDPFQVGFRFPEWTIIRQYSEQAERLTASGIEPSLYNDYAEIGLYGLDGFRAMTKGGMSIDGYVLLQMRYRQKESIYLDEPLLIRGWVEAVRPTPIGPNVHHVYQFHRPTGEILLINDIIGITAQAEQLVQHRQSRPPEKHEPRADPTDGFILIQEKRLTPHGVRVFSQDVGNSIHFDREFAARYGFQAPLAQGVMTAVWLISALVRQKVPKKMDINIHFLRPVFWDDRAWLWGKPDPTGRNPYEMVRSTNDANKVTAEMRIEHLDYQG
jgi:hypothetical protein